MGCFPIPSGPKWPKNGRLDDPHRIDALPRAAPQPGTAETLTLKK